MFLQLCKWSNNYWWQGKLDGHISDGDYLTCNKIFYEFNMKITGNYHDHYLKKDVLL